MSTKGIVNPSISMNVEYSKSTTFYALRPDNMIDLLDYINGLSWQIVENVSNDPGSFITSVRIYPFDFTATDSGNVAQDTSIKVGRWECDLGTGGMTSEYCYKLTSGYKTHFNLGTYTFTPYFNNFLDYSPYTKYELYLPYCGFVDMDATEYTGKTISIDYILDYTTGGCTAVVSDITNENDHIVLFSKKGMVGVPITWQATNSGQILRGAINTALSVGGMAVGGAISTKKANKAGLARYESDMADYDQRYQTARDSAYDSGITGDDELKGHMLEWKANNPAPKEMDYKQSNPYLTSNIITSGYNGITNAIVNSPYHVTRGEMGGDFSIFSMPQKPYIIITRTHTVLPASYNELMGKPSGKTATLSELNGFTSIDAIRVEGIKSVNGVSPTSVELVTIDKALRSGVIL